MYRLLVILLHLHSCFSCKNIYVGKTANKVTIMNGDSKWAGCSKDICTNEIEIVTSDYRHCKFTSNYEIAVNESFGYSGQQLGDCEEFKG